MNHVFLQLFPNCITHFQFLLYEKILSVYDTRETELYIHIESCHHYMQSMTKKRSILSLFFATYIFYSGERFSPSNMHITNVCLVMCVEHSCESVVCCNVYIYVCILLLIETLQSQSELVAIVSIGLYPLCTRIGLVQIFS